MTDRRDYWLDVVIAARRPEDRPVLVWRGYEDDMTEKAPTIVNMHTAPEIAADVPAAWTHFRRALTPAMKDAGPGRFGMGRLGMSARRVPPGHSACPAHTHLMADEIFIVLEGQGLFRYGDRVHEIRPGDCISCPADTGIAHQIANPATPDGRGDLVYLAIGAEPPADVCTYPDSGALVIDALGRHGFLREADYYEGQPQPTPLLTRGRDAPV